MARGCRDDLPDEQNGIFFLAGLDSNWLIWPSGKYAFTSRHESALIRYEIDLHQSTPQPT
jgi:hypothetical protein